MRGGGEEAGDARSWDEEGYRKSIVKERRLLTQTVFRTVFEPTRSPIPDVIVVASSDGSLSSYHLSSCLSSPTFGSTNCTNTDFLQPDPNWRIQGHDGPSYDLKFYGDNEDSLLLSCGDDGVIRGWKWKEIAHSNVPLQFQGYHCKPILEMESPQHKGPWGALSPIAENNALAINPNAGVVYAAAGDCCAYCWDLESCKIKSVFKGHSDYLHCIVARNSANQIITGSEDGTARIWDCKSGKCAQVIKLKKAKTPISYISCVALDSSESWLACGGDGGLFVWSIAACECISNVTTGAPIQDMTFDGNQVMAVGAHPLLTRLHINGTVVSQIQCSPLSAFSISLHKSGVGVVGGYGGVVDVVSQFGSHLCTFRSSSLWSTHI